MNIEPIPEADLIEEITVGGWHTVAQKNDFKPGDLCVFFEIDAVLNPELSWVQQYASFLVHTNWRVRTAKKKGIYCQGLALRTDILTEPFEEGQEVSELLGVTKYEIPEIASTAGMPKGSFPISLIPKTDELRIQSDLQLLEELKGHGYYITQKCDGTSATFLFEDGEFTVCSRNLAMKDTPDSAYWKMARYYKIEEALRKIGTQYAIQAELCGPGIQKNAMGLDKLDLFVFTLYNTKERKPVSYHEMLVLQEKYGMKLVPRVELGSSFDYTLEELLDKAEGKYDSGKELEGIVVRPTEPWYSKTAQKYLSFKVLNNHRLAKEK